MHTSGDCMALMASTSFLVRSFPMGIGRGPTPARTQASPLQARFKHQFEFRVTWLQSSMQSF